MSKLLLLFSAILTLIYGTIAGIDLWKHLKFSSEIQVVSIAWEPVPKGGKWGLKGIYEYKIYNKNFIGSDVLPKPYHLNLKSAEKEIESLKQLPWTIWVDPHHPENSLLENPFPLKKIVYVGCVLLVTLYFAYLKFHVELLSSKL